MADSVGVSPDDSDGVAGDRGGAPCVGEHLAVVLTGLNDAAHGEAAGSGGVAVLASVREHAADVTAEDDASSDMQLSETEPSFSPSPVSSVDPLECSSAEKGDPAAADRAVHADDVLGLGMARTVAAPVAFLTTTLGLLEEGAAGVGPCCWDLCSAASALLMLSCFFHLVLRFWNQILTCNTKLNGH